MRDFMHEVSHNNKLGMVRMRCPFPMSLFLVVLIAGVPGCATPKAPEQPPSGFVDVPCPADKALVYLYRVRVWHPDGNGIKMCVNGVPVVALHGREYCPLILDPGPVSFAHEVEVGPYGMFPGLMKDLELQLEPRQTYFVAYRFWASPFHKRPNPTMVLVDRATGTNEISICTIKKPL
jgi:hypothetical protein